MSFQQPPGYGPPQGYGPPPSGNAPPPQWNGPPPGYGAPPPVKKNLTLGQGCLAVFGVLFVAGMCVNIMNRDTARGSNAASQATEPPAGAASPPASTGGSATPARAKKDEPSFVSESCLDLSTKFGPSSKLSDLQKEEMWPRYKGKAFKWRLQVVEVSSDMFGGYTVQFKCAPQSPSLIQDVQVKYGDKAKSFVVGLTKGSTYEITGVLGMSSTLLGMTADALP